MLNALKSKTNVTRTENGAKSNKSTNSAVLDFYFHAPSMRGKDAGQYFLDALREDELLALKCLFYVRDIRGGKGERETFRSLLRLLYNQRQDLFDKVVVLAPIYGRWDDLLEFTDSEVVREIVRVQLLSDLDADNPSLLGKWMPSINTHSQDKVRLAYKWAKIFNFSPKEYRQLLSHLRDKIGVVERLMTFGEWSKIDYSKLPSKASFKYRKSFGKRDNARYVEFIKKAIKGQVKINSKTMFVHELAANAYRGNWDETIEAMWNQLPDYGGGKNILIVADQSGSMWWPEAQLPDSQFYAGDVANALAIYFADRNKGQFAKHFMTFDSHPRLVELTGKTLREKTQEVRYGAGAGTNLQAVFGELLTKAKKFKVEQSEMPEMIVILSDMQFNSVGGDKTNMDAIEEQYKTAGYKLPKLLFWNLASRRQETPVTKDKKGVYLASGFSIDTFEKVLLLDESPVPVQTPYDMMLMVLNGERYQPVANVLEG